MIYTLTFAPSLDYYLDVADFQSGKINRAVKEKYFAGGKGINVSLLLKELQRDSIALGFISGFTGDEIERILLNNGIKTDFVRTSGNSRINVKINSATETAINAVGPDITRMEISLMLGKLNQLRSGDILSIGGAIPSALPKDIYVKVMKVLESKKVKIIVDASGDLLLESLPYHPFLVKPNQEELEELEGQKLSTPGAVLAGAKHLVALGAQNVIVSQGDKGALMIDSDGNIYRKEAVRGKFKSSVGAGDSLIGGFIAGYLTYANYEDALDLGMAAGSATAFSNHISKKEDILEIYNRIQKGKKIIL